MAKIKALFLDRDDTINVNIPYLNDVNKLEYLPGLFPMLKKIADLDYRIFIVTNQSGLSRELIKFDELEEIHAQMREDFILKGLKIEKFYISPYIHANYRRKPGPGLLLEAARDFNIDLSASIMIGDGERDIQAGKNAGVSKTFLVSDINTFWLNLDIQDFN